MKKKKLNFAPQKRKPFFQFLSTWFLQVRGPFLILSVVLVLIGASAARHDGFWSWGHTGLLLVGVVCAHASVNLFNELSDFETGLDSRTRRTPFSGGSGLMQMGTTSPASVRTVAYGLLSVSAMIGLYFYLRSGWLILFFMISGGIAVRFYTSYLSKLLVGEIISGLTLGTFVVLGAYFAMTRRLQWEIIYISIPPGILTSLLLFLNEFPDAEADRAGGRHHLVILLGKNKSAVLYAAGMGLAYVLTALSPCIVNAPKTILFSLLTLPLAVKAVLIALHGHDRFEKMVAAQALNTAVVILTDLLMAAGYWIKTTGSL